MDISARTQIIGIACLSLLASACRPTVPTNALTLVTAPDYCPYELTVKGPDGKSSIIGFDIDVAEAIAAELSLPLKVEPKHFNQIMPMLERQQADFAMAAITPTVSRRQVMEFSSIYYAQTIAIISRQDHPFNQLEELINKQVGVKAKSFQSKELTRYSDIEQIEFNTAKELIAAVKAKRVEAGILDQAIAPKYITPASQLTWHPINTQSENAGVAIAFPKEASTNLKADVNSVLAKLQQNGTITRLIHKWFEDYECPQDIS